MKHKSKSSEMAHNLPVQATPFIGRVNEVAEIGKLLAHPTCRLLTLVGPGGIGKTRLAIEVAAANLGKFANGIYFVPLQPVRSTEFLVSAIADAVKFLLSGREDPSVQLLNYLREKEMLLVLDNFEHLLLEHGVKLVIDSLKAAPKVKFLVTSREVLNLQEEWLYPVQGLPFPHIQWARDFWTAMQPFSTGGVYVNFLTEDEGEDRVRAAYGANYERLRALKNKYDPTNLFQVNQNIKPTG